MDATPLLNFVLVSNSIIICIIWHILFLCLNSLLEPDKKNEIEACLLEYMQYFQLVPEYMVQTNEIQGLFKDEVETPCPLFHTLSLPTFPLPLFVLNF